MAKRNPVDKRRESTVVKFYGEHTIEETIAEFGLSAAQVQKIVFSHCARRREKDLKKIRLQNPDE